MVGKSPLLSLLLLVLLLLLVTEDNDKSGWDVIVEAETGVETDVKPAKITIDKKVVTIRT
jgi:hypothetical protein